MFSSYCILDHNEGDQLTMTDFIKEIDQSQQVKPIKKQIKKIMKDGSKQLTMPLSGIKRQRMERKANYVQNKKNISKWVDQVRQMKDADQVDFTIEENKIKSKTAAAIASEYHPKSDLEMKVQAALGEAGIESEKQILE